MDLRKYKTNKNRQIYKQSLQKRARRDHINRANGIESDKRPGREHKTQSGENTK